MKLSGFLSVLIGLALAIAIVAFANFVLHVPDGWGRGAVFLVAALVFLVFAFGPGRLWGRSINDKQGR